MHIGDNGSVFCFVFPPCNCGSPETWKVGGCGFHGGLCSRRPSTSPATFMGPSAPTAVAAPSTKMSVEMPRDAPRCEGHSFLPGKAGEEHRGVSLLEGHAMQNRAAFWKRSFLDQASICMTPAHTPLGNFRCTYSALMRNLAFRTFQPVNFFT